MGLQIQPWCCEGPQKVGVRPMYLVQVSLLWPSDTGNPSQPYEDWDLYLRVADQGAVVAGYDEDSVCQAPIEVDAAALIAAIRGRPFAGLVGVPHVPTTVEDGLLHSFNDDGCGDDWSETGADLHIGRQDSIHTANYLGEVHNGAYLYEHLQLRTNQPHRLIAWMSAYHSIGYPSRSVTPAKLIHVRNLWGTPTPPPDPIAQAYRLDVRIVDGSRTFDQSLDPGSGIIVYRNGSVSWPTLAGDVTTTFEDWSVPDGIGATGQVINDVGFDEGAHGYTDSFTGIYCNFPDIAPLPANNSSFPANQGQKAYNP